MRLKREFFRYVIPSMLAFALSGIYAIADGFFVGNRIGDNALAAINISYPMNALILSVGTGIGIGGAILYTFSKNSGQTEKRHQYFAVALIMMLAVSVFLTILLPLIAVPLMSLFGAAGIVLDLSVEYLRWIAYGTIFQVLGTGLVPFIRNMGGAISSMVAMICGFICNVGFDWLFVWILDFGMIGAALATVIGQAATFVVCLVYILRKKELPHFRCKGNYLRFIKRITGGGFSAFGLAFSPNIILIFVNKSAEIFGGSLALACYAIIGYVTCTILLILQGISDGCQPLISKLYSEGDVSSAKKVRRIGYIFAMITTFILCAVIFFTRDIVSLLFGSSAEVSKEVGAVMPIFLFGLLFSAFSRISISYFYAIEKNKNAYLLIYSEPVFLVIFLAILPYTALHLTGTWLSVALAQCCVCIGSIIFILVSDRRQKEKPTELPD